MTASPAFPQTVRTAIDQGLSPLTAVRRWRRLTQLALAKAVGCSEGYISELEKGEKLGSSEMRDQIAKVLGVSHVLPWPRSSIGGEALEEA